MKISSLKSTLYSVPPTVEWIDATHHVSSIEFLVTQIETDHGPSGVGFAYTTGVGGSAIRALIDDDCRDLVIGEDPLRPQRLNDMLHRHLHRCGTGGINTLAVAAIDIALWDICAKHYNVPLHSLLGGVRESVPFYGSGIDLHLDESGLQEEVEEFLRLDTDAIKIKVGRSDPLEDLARIDQVLSKIGPSRQLFVDANQKWNLSEAITRLGGLATRSIGWIEEPLHAEDIQGHADLRRSFGLPIAAGESLYTKHQIQAYLAQNAIDVIQADVCRVGGITDWLEIAHLAAAHHKTVSPHYLAEISIAVLCAVPNGEWLEWVRGGSFSEMGLLEEPLRLEGGRAFPFQTPGHGIRFRWDQLAQFEVPKTV